MKKSCRMLCLAAFCALAIHSPLSATAQGVTDVQVRFVKSPLADYLLYLFHRSTGKFPQLEKEVPLGSTPTLGERTSLPEQVASAQFTDYGRIYSLLSQYQHPAGRVMKIGKGTNQRFRILGYDDKLPPYDRLKMIIDDGSSLYPAFRTFWQANIAPLEDAQITGWKAQLTECKPLEKLQKIERLSFPFSHLDVAAIALHRSGSGNTDPAGVYSRLFQEPDLAWLLGHEATHLMVDRYAGHDWYDNPAAARAIELVKQHGGSAADIEESLSLFMQVKLSQACGYTSTTLRIADSFPANTSTGAILRSLESGWDEYLKHEHENMIDFLLRRTQAAFERE